MQRHIEMDFIDKIEQSNVYLIDEYATKERNFIQNKINYVESLINDKILAAPKITKKLWLNEKESIDLKVKY